MSEKQATLYVRNLNEKVTITRLKYVLTKLFSRYGTVLSITAHKNLKMKGQAFVTYKDVESCEKALSKLQGRPVFKSPIQISYAKSSSDAYKLQIGDLEGVEKRKKAKKERAQKEQKEKPRSATPSVSRPQVQQWKSLPPHHVLLLQNLEESKLDEDFLTTSFQKFAGFERVRLIKFRKLAFIDFDKQESATACLAAVDHSSFGESSLLSYAKR